jgi:DNA-binding NtrC family response regulator
VKTPFADFSPSPARLSFLIFHSKTMHVLVVDDNHTNGLSQALQLSGHGLIVETVSDVEEAGRRLSAITFDAVVYNVPPWDQDGKDQLQMLQSLHPNTQFYASEKINEFLKRIRKGHSA